MSEKSRYRFWKSFFKGIASINLFPPSRVAKKSDFSEERYRIDAMIRDLNSIQSDFNTISKDLNEAMRGELDRNSKKIKKRSKT